MARCVEFSMGIMRFSPGGIKMARQRTRKQGRHKLASESGSPRKVGQRAGRNVGLEANWKLANYGEPRKGWVV